MEDFVLWVASQDVSTGIGLLIGVCLLFGALLALYCFIHARRPVGGLAGAAIFGVAFFGCTVLDIATTVQNLQEAGAVDKVSAILSALRDDGLVAANEVSSDFEKNKWLGDADRISLLSVSGVVRDSNVKAQLISVAKATASVKADKDRVIKLVLGVPADQLAGDNTSAAAIIAGLK